MFAILTLKKRQAGLCAAKWALERYRLFTITASVLAMATKKLGCRFYLVRETKTLSRTALSIHLNHGYADVTTIVMWVLFVVSQGKQVHAVSVVKWAIVGMKEMSSHQTFSFGSESSDVVFSSGRDFLQWIDSVKDDGVCPQQVRWLAIACGKCGQTVWKCLTGRWPGAFCILTSPGSWPLLVLV